MWLEEEEKLQKVEGRPPVLVMGKKVEKRLRSYHEVDIA